MPRVCPVLSVHSLLHLIKECGGVVYGGTTEHHVHTRVGLVYLMDAQRLLVCGSSYYEDYDVLGSPVEKLSSYRRIQVLSQFPFDEVFQSVLEQRRVLSVDVFHATETLT